MKNKIILLLISLILLTSYCSPANKKIQPKVVKGVLDLSNWDFDKDGVINLDGDWEFYWQEFIDPNSLDLLTDQTQPKYIPVPGKWNNFEVDGTQIGGDGFATYKIRIINGNGNNLGLKTNTVFSNFELFIQNESKLKNGKLGKDKENSDYKIKSIILDQIEIQDNNLDLMLHVSNYYHTEGGIKFSILLGKTKHLHELKQNNLSINFFLFGALFIMSLYHFGLFLLRKKDRSTLYFSFFCFVFSIRQFFTGEKFFYDLFYFLDPSYLTKIEYSLIYLATHFMILFQMNLFPNEFRNKLFKILSILFQILTGVALLSNLKLLTTSQNYFYVVLILYLCSTMYSIIKAAVNKREGAFAFILGFAVITIFAINDILFIRGYIHTGFLFPFAVFLFVFSQSYMLSSKFSKAFKQSEESLKLAEERKLEIEKLNKAKDEFLANLSHELKTPLTYIYMYAEMLSSPTEAEAVIEYAKAVFSNAQKLNDYVEDLILITDIESNIKLNLESISPNVIIEEVVDTVKKLTLEKNICIKLNLTQSINLSIDKNLLIKSIQAVIKNAILYSNENGIVEINSKSDSMNFILSVKDTGIGISKENQQKIFDKFFRVDTSLNYEISGVGVGLFLTKKIVDLFKGKVEVISEIGVGSEFIITIPLATNFGIETK